MAQTQKNDTTNEQIHQLSLIKPMLIGALVGLILISVFVFGVDEPNPAWGEFWMIKPLILTPVIGAMGGLFYYFMNYLSTTGFNKTLAIIIGILGFVIAQWLGIVLGLNGTMWD